MALMVCEVCKTQGEDTKIPHDEIGIELMKAHLFEKHGVRL